MIDIVNSCGWCDQHKKGGLLWKQTSLLTIACKNTPVPFTSCRSRLPSAEGMLKKRQEGVNQTSTPLFY
jgi:hypothetical protein